MGSWTDWLLEQCLRLVSAIPEWLPVSIGILGILLVLVSVVSMARRAGPPRRGEPARRAGQPYRFVGNLLLMLGTVTLLMATGAYLAGATDADRALPSPLASDGTRSESSAVDAMGQPRPGGLVSADDVEATAVPLPTASVATPTATPVPVTPGLPVRVVIPTIGVDSKVTELGYYIENGQVIWQTAPWVIGHYRTTAKAGAEGNAVFSGHVTSRNAGNVFKDLYQLQVGDEVHIFTEDDELTYLVTDVREVLPTDTSVMDPTTDATATLITCAGQWIPEEKQYSRRLIVTAKLQR